jgi:hypothetical protein
MNPIGRMKVGVLHLLHLLGFALNGFFDGLHLPEDDMRKGGDLNAVLLKFDLLLLLLLPSLR